MKIENIKRYKNFYVINLSDGKSLSFYDVTIIKYNLLKPREINNKELTEMIKYNNEVEAYIKALKFINIKLRTKDEVKKKLNEYDKLIVDNVLNRLEKNGCLNDLLYIKSFINDQVNLTNNGPKKILSSLINLGFNEDEIINELKIIEEDVWLNKIKKIINKKTNANHNLSKSMLLQKIKNYLINLGYDINMINLCLENYDLQENNQILEKEYNKLLRRYSKKYDEKILKNKIKYGLYQKGFRLEDIEKII